MSPRVQVALEVGKKRTFATALDWPGWCRAGGDEDEALETLLAYAPRYAPVVSRSVLGFTPPLSVSALEVVERLPGNASTEFGVPGAPPSVDAEPVAATDLTRLEAIMCACWDAFAQTADAAGGRELRKGARGGGRDLDEIRAHVEESDAAYLAKLGGKVAKGASLDEVHEAFIEALGARARGELPDVGPRGGRRWSARFAVRYSAWHALDHTWEIEGRI